jgi:hypothetical protein
MTDTSQPLAWEVTQWPIRWLDGDSKLVGREEPDEPDDDEWWEATR